MYSSAVMERREKRCTHTHKHEHQKTERRMQADESEKERTEEPKRVLQQTT